MKTNRKKITKYTGGGMTGAAIGSSALQGLLGGATMGPLGMLGGAAMGAWQGWQADKIQRDNIAGMDESRELADAERERLMAEEQRQYNKQILDQYNVKGYRQPRYEGGGDTAGGTPQVGPPPNGRRWNLADLFRTLPQAQKLLFDEDIQKAYGSMSDEEVQALIGTAVPMIEDIRGAEGLGDKIGVVKDADLSWIKPLREKAGLSKNQMIDKAAEAGMLKKWATLPVKGAAAFMDFELGGPTNQGEIRPMPDGINMTTGLSGAANPHEAMIRPDGGMENLLEFIDPTGLSSWDDAYRAYQGMKQDGRYLPNFGEAADMFGAIPLIGKAGKGAKLGAQLLGAAGRGVNMFDTVQDLYSENFAMGGQTMGPQYEAEGGEMIQYKPGDTPKVYGNGGISMMTGTEGEIKGPSHAQGGVDMSDEKGARIYSNKLTVDPALMAKLSKL